MPNVILSEKFLWQDDVKNNFGYNQNE